ncbi:MAG: serine/threonine protein kinase [Planctomycetota bacterium]|nr:MAG: serine/threonine protein kinase [Planctomycetota bacterium]
MSGYPKADDASSALVARLGSRAVVQGRYQVHDEIARGGMGAILRVWDDDLHRDLAMKVLLPEVEPGPVPDAVDSAIRTPAPDVRLLARFLEEAQLTAQLDHPGVVPVHELGLNASGRVYFTMKLVKGRTLGEVFDLAADGRDGWTRTRVLGLILRVCEAMAYAHHKGVIHRDLKPANVMVGGFGEVYVMDWGLARILDAPDRKDIHIRTERQAQRAEAPDSPLYTVDGDVLGTPAYMPPEQALGNLEEVGPHSDVYSLGAMLYHLLAGHMPYASRKERLSNQAILMMVRQAAPSPLHRLAPDVPAELLAITEKAMARDWRERYGNMQELAEDLRAFLEKRVVRAYQTGAWAEARKWVQRNRGLAAALLSSVLLLAGGLGASIVLKEQSDRHAERAQSELRKANTTAGFLEAILAGVSPWVALGRDTALLKSLLDEATQRIEGGELADAPESELRLRLVLGNTCKDIAEHESAERALQAALGLARTLHSGDHANVAESLDRLATVLQARNKLEAAEALFREALEMRRRLHAGDDADVAASLNNLALLLHTRCDYAAAESHYREALGMFQRMFRGDHLSVAGALGNLAGVLQDQGNLAAARSFQDEALQMYERLYPGDHPAVAIALSNLGTLLQEQGNLAAAESRLRDALEMRRRLYPDGHPDVARSLNNLAALLQDLGDGAAAELHHRQALDEYRRFFPGDNISVALTMTSLARLQEARGDLGAAEALCREALDMARRLFPDEHAEVARILNALASVLKARNDAPAAESLFREALEMRRRIFAGDHPDLAESLNNLGLLLRQQGRLDEAEPLARGAVDMYRRLFPGDHAALAMSLNNLALLLQAREQWDAAEAMLRESLDMKRRARPGDHMDTVKGLNNLAELLRQRGKLEAAESFYREALEMIRRLVPGDDAFVAGALGNYALFLRQRGQLGDAELYYRQALDMWRRLAPNGHPWFAVALGNLGQLLEERGDYTAAESLYREGLAMRQRLQPTDHKGIGRIQLYLGRCLRKQERFEDAEPLLLQAESTLAAAGLSASDEFKKTLQALVDLYRSWEEAEPGSGHEQRAAEWKSKLDEEPQQ